MADNRNHLYRQGGPNSQYPTDQYGRPLNPQQWSSEQQRYPQPVAGQAAPYPHPTGTLVHPAQHTGTLQPQYGMPQGNIANPHPHPSQAGYYNAQFGAVQPGSTIPSSHAQMSPAPHRSSSSHTLGHSVGQPPHNSMYTQQQPQPGVPHAYDMMPAGAHLQPEYAPPYLSHQSDGPVPYGAAPPGYGPQPLTTGHVALNQGSGQGTYPGPTTSAALYPPPNSYPPSPSSRTSGQGGDPRFSRAAVANYPPQHTGGGSRQTVSSHVQGASDPGFSADAGYPRQPVVPPHPSNSGGSQQVSAGYTEPQYAGGSSSDALRRRGGGSQAIYRAESSPLASTRSSESHLLPVDSSTQGHRASSSGSGRTGHGQQTRRHEYAAAAPPAGSTPQYTTTTSQLGSSVQTQATPTLGSARERTNTRSINLRWSSAARQRLNVSMKGGTWLNNTIQKETFPGCTGTDLVELEKWHQDKLIQHVKMHYPHGRSISVLESAHRSPSDKNDHISFKVYSSEDRSPGSEILVSPEAAYGQSFIGQETHHLRTGRSWVENPNAPQASDHYPEV